MIHIQHNHHEALLSESATGICLAAVWLYALVRSAVGPKKNNKQDEESKPHEQTKRD